MRAGPFPAQGRDPVLASSRRVGVSRQSRGWPRGRVVRGIRVADNQVAKSLSSQFFITAVLLALFGLAENAPELRPVLELPEQPRHDPARPGRRHGRRRRLPPRGHARRAGPGAVRRRSHRPWSARTRCSSGMGYIPGTIVAIYGLFHLLNAEAAFAEPPAAGERVRPAAVLPRDAACGHHRLRPGAVRAELPTAPPATGSATSGCSARPAAGTVDPGSAAAGATDRPVRPAVRGLIQDPEPVSGWAAASRARSSRLSRCRPRS